MKGEGEGEDIGIFLVLKSLSTEEVLGGLAGGTYPPKVSQSKQTTNSKKRRRSKNRKS